jgi:F-type H+-transporting ATPase subunit b
MELVQPAFGLVFWMLVSFLIVLFILGKFAWKPILKALKERETSIEEALRSADKAREAMENLKADNEKLLSEARAERELMLREARDTKDAIINEAKGKATTEANRLLQMAREAINNEKQAAITELKNQVATLSIEIAEKILREQLKDSAKQKELAEKYLKEVKMN